MAYEVAETRERLHKLACGGAGYVLHDVFRSFGFAAATFAAEE